jgi:GTP 3',8-cyclase
LAVPIKSRIEGGYIVPPTALEIIVADHCNISCRQCNHGAPGVAKWFADPAEVGRNLAILAKIYRPAYIKLIGGEPLLHPDLADLVAEVRGSGISQRFMLCTNGLLLHRMADAAWRLVDEVAVSLYAATGDLDDNLALARAKAREFGVTLTLSAFPDFRETFSAIRTEDTALVRQVYAACKLANVWGMHALHRGRIYKCPQSIYVPRLAGRAFDDGIEIRDTPEFRAELLAFVNSPEPLEACRHCVGTVGKKLPHRLVPRRQWRDDLATPAEQMIDYDLLARSLAEPDPHDDCRMPTGTGTTPR